MRRTLLFSSRALVLSCGLFVALAGALPHAAAQTRPRAAAFDRNRIIGEVTNLQGPLGNPDSFTLELGYLSYDLRISPRTVYVSRSAEAQIEGLVNGDYALVLARRMKRQVVVFKIIFDVQPFWPLHEFSGMIKRVSPDQMRVVVKLLGTNHSFVFRLNRQTRFRLDGRLADIAPTLVKGEQIHILALQRNGWIGFEVDLHPSTNGNKQFH